MWVVVVVVKRFVAVAVRWRLRLGGRYMVF